MCKRNTDDPLLRTFLDRYNLHLLSIPREDAAVGDLYVHDGKRASSPGSVTHFLEPAMKVPAVNTGERMADVLGKVSHAVTLTVGLGLLESFLAALGGGGLLTKVKAGFESTQTASLKFRFADSTRDSVDVMKLGAALITRKIREDHALAADGNRYYLVTAVARSAAISVVAETDAAATVNLDLGALNLADVTTSVGVKRTAEGEVTFKGKKSLGFGVELYELALDKKRNRLMLGNPKDPIRVRGASAPVVDPAFIGGPDGEIFI